MRDKAKLKPAYYSACFIDKGSKRCSYLLAEVRRPDVSVSMLTVSMVSLRLELFYFNLDSTRLQKLPVYDL